MAILEISYLNQTIAMSTMKGGLKPSRLPFGLEKRFPIDYIEMLSQAKKYANVEEAMVARKDALTSRTERESKRRREEPSDRDR